MFRTGGTPNEGIMHGLVDRKNYNIGTHLLLSTLILNTLILNSPAFGVCVCVCVCVLGFLS